ncbi:CBR-FHOD-2 protein [Loa loa]|uniref:CBR-FHOD-2 protein n=1 Tax=Loa loa TaxID=7209 RepID=A0A1S0UF81_LOALO|nr:CBR-FHOD-2 protein [Loa loa]EJD74101.1 CBR-FHOD-2 protein [Loa loa]
MHLRFELLMLGLHNILEQLRATSSTVLDDHFDLFEMIRQEDEQHFTRSDSGTSTPIDVENPTDMIDILMERLNNTIAMPHFISILQHLMLLSSDHKNINIWRLLDIVLQQLVLHVKMDVCTDIQEPIVSIDMNNVLSRLHTQNEYDNLERIYNELEEELRKERMHVIELQNRLADYDLRSIYSRTSADSTDSTFPSDPCQSSSSSTSSSVPPICPPSQLPPPPPPPSSLLQLSINGDRVLTETIDMKKIPKSRIQLKTLNWIIIPKERIIGTIWENIDEEKLYQQLDLEDITQNFSLNKVSIDETESINETLRRQRTETFISIIEPRRAQNCTIMLSKLRLSNKQIKHAILSMDQYGELPRDMIEQMLKFLPTKEEISKVCEIVNKYKTPGVLSVADRFFYEISNIPRYEERLRCLHIISTYHERIDDVTNTIKTVTNASIAVTNSKRLRQLLRMILALGNFLNNGKRNGNAYGFTLASLRLLIDVRNSLRSDRNLLHYIVEQIENKKSDVLRLKRDLESVYQAARHSRKEIEQELCALRKSITVVTEALNGNETGNDDDDDAWNNECDRNVDRFSEVLKNFLNSIENNFAQVERQYGDMNTKFRVCVRLFAEEPRTTSPDDFFGVISKFLTALIECHQQIWEERENLERLKKQTLARSILSKKCKLFHSKI